MDKQDMVGGGRWFDRQLRARQVAMQERSRKIDDERAQVDLEMAKAKRDRIKKQMEVSSAISQGYGKLLQSNASPEQLLEFKRKFMATLPVDQAMNVLEITKRYDDASGAKAKINERTNVYALRELYRSRTGKDAPDEWGPQKLKSATTWLHYHPNESEIPLSSTTSNNGQTISFGHNWEKIETDNMETKNKRAVFEGQPSVDLARKKAEQEKQVERSANVLGMSDSQTKRGQHFADAIYKDKQVAGFIKARESFQALENLAQADPSGPIDVALVFKFMKALDPGSVVREGEFATAEASHGIVSRMVNYWNKLVRGERFKPGERALFADAAREALQAARDAALGNQEHLIKQAVNEGIPEGFFVRILDGDGSKSPMVSGGSSAGSTGKSYTTKSGNRVIIQD